MTHAERENILRLVTEVLTVHGGLNERSKRALLEIARLHALGAPEILEILERVARLEAGSVPSHAGDALAPRDGQETDTVSESFIEEGRSRRTFSRILALMTLLLWIGSLVLLVPVFLASTRPLERANENAEQLVPPVDTADSFTPPAQASPSPAPLSTQAADSYDALLGPIDAAPDRVRRQGLVGLSAVATSIETLSETWPALDRATVESAAGRLANLLLEFERRDESAAAERLLELILAPSAHLVSASGGRNADLASSRIIPGAWSVGLVTRLTRETHPDPMIRERLESHLSTVFGGAERPSRPSFRDGASALLAALSRRMIETSSLPFRAVEEGAWEDVRRGFASLSLYNERSVTGTVLDLISDAMRSSSDGATTTGIGRSITTLTSLVDWSSRECGQSLVSWFDDPSVPTPALALLMQTVSRTPGAPDFASLQAITPESPPIRRAAVRDQIAELYVLPASPSDGWVEHAWAPSVKRALREDSTSEDSVGALARATVSARLTAAAALRWRGETADAERERSVAFDAVGEARESMITSAPPAPDLASLTSPADGSDGRFVLAYANAGRDNEKRLEAIRALGASPNPIGPADADVLAEAAYFAVPLSNRREAQQVATAHADSIAMVHALLETFDRAPRLEMTRDFLAGVADRPLPEHDNPAWSLETRVALVERLHDLVATGTSPLVDRLADDILRTVALRAGDAAVSSTSVSSAWASGALRAAQRYRETPLSEHAPERVSARRDRRLAIARGPIQRFAAEQVSGVEFVASTVAAERPSMVREIRAILEEMESSRERASHAFQQIESCERALLRLWAIRLDIDLDDVQEEQR